MNNYSVEIREEYDGGFLAVCPEMNLFARGETQEEALLKLQSLIIFATTNAEGTDVDLTLLKNKDFNPGNFTLFIPQKNSTN